MLKTLALGLAAGVALAANPAAAQSYPDRAVTFIVPYGPGGTSDIGARTWQPFMEKCLGKPITIVNKPGAGGELGFAELANAKPDGYTIGALNVPNMPLGTITKPSPAYSVDSFTYLGNFYGSLVTINAKSGTPWATLKDMIAAAKAKRLNMGISNFGSDDHVMMLRFLKAAGIQLTYIPLSDAASARNAIIGGHVDVSGLSMTEVTPFQKELKTLAIAAEARVPALPDVPTFKEQGFDIVGGSNHVIGGPKGLPADVAGKLSGCFASVAKDPDFVKAAATRTLLLRVMDAGQTEAWVRQETKVLAELWKTDPWGK